MSWNIDIIGDPEAVAAAVTSTEGIPQALKDTVSAIAQNPTVTGYLLAVKTSGHLGQNGSGGIWEFQTRWLPYVRNPVRMLDATGTLLTCASSQRPSPAPD
ncbi:MAG: hypothetical protein KGJ13_11355 [Patescibacteria group bacterium]|nr:hypothetical protein [Patescibacteria group bacterium]